jgi:hypothetical protein
MYRLFSILRTLFAQTVHHLYKSGRSLQSLIHNNKL